MKKKQKQNKVYSTLFLLFACILFAAFSTYKPIALKYTLREARKQHLVRYLLVTANDGKTIEIKLMSTTRSPIFIEIPQNTKLFIKGRKKHSFKTIGKEVIELAPHTELNQFIDIESLQKNNAIPAGINLAIKKY